MGSDDATISMRVSGTVLLVVWLAFGIGFGVSTLAIALVGNSPIVHGLSSVISGVPIIIGGVASIIAVLWLKWQFDKCRAPAAEEY